MIAAALLLCASILPLAHSLYSPLAFTPTFLPTPLENGFRNESLHSWGGGVLLVDGSYHLFSSAFVNNCGLGSWGSNSVAIHATSSSPLGPFAFQERALPYYHHNVAPIQAPDGTFLIFSIGMVPDPLPSKCTADEAGVFPPPPGPLQHGFESIECWSSPSVWGPWTPVAGTINGRNLFNGTNPAPVFDPSGNGTIYVMSHGGNGAMTLSTAPSWRGPYASAVPIFSMLVDDYTGEDPFVWWDARIANDEGGVGAWRVLYHSYNTSDTHHQVRVGGYAQSAGPSIWGPWRVQSDRTPAYTTAVTYAGSPPSVVTLSRRERPKLFLDPATGAPAVLYTGVCPANDGSACFTLAVPIAPEAVVGGAETGTVEPVEPVAAAAILTREPAAVPPLALTVLPQDWADVYGAKCLDGSPPAHYALIQDPTRWVVFIEGGGWCFTPASCASRAAGGGGSSRNNAQSMDVGGLLSPNATINPRFFNCSFVFIRYCDGSSHSSGASAPLPVPEDARVLTGEPDGAVPHSTGSGVVPAQVWLRGRANLDAQIQYLLQRRGMSAAREVILTGGSAGGTSVFLAADHVAAMMPKGARFVAAPDA